MRLILVILCLLLSGCSAMTIHRDADGKVNKVVCYGNIEGRVTDTETYGNAKIDIFKDMVSVNAVK